MTKLSAEKLRRLYEVGEESDYVISFFLNVNGAKYPRRQDLEAVLKGVLRAERRRWSTEAGLSRDEIRRREGDLTKISDFVAHRLRRDHVKGLAVYTCADRGFWEVFELPVPVPTMIVTGRRPYTKVISSLLDQLPRYLVVVVGRRKARIFTLYLGDIEEHLDLLEDNVPGQVADGDWSGWRQKKIAHHIEDHVQRHLKHVAARTEDYYRRRRYDRLLIGGLNHIVNDFKAVLPSHLSRLVVGDFPAGPNLPESEILKRSLAAAENVEREAEEALLRRLLEAGKPGGAAVVGLEPTVEALLLGQVHILVVADGAAAGGAVCEKCRYISTYMETCPVCGSKLNHWDDIMEYLIQRAVTLDCRVRYIHRPPDFANQFQIGAFLRYNL